MVDTKSQISILAMEHTDKDVDRSMQDWLSVACRDGCLAMGFEALFLDECDKSHVWPTYNQHASLRCIGAS